jgi:hypothetical protein
MTQPEAVQPSDKKEASSVSPALKAEKNEMQSGRNGNTGQKSSDEGTPIAALVAKWRELSDRAYQDSLTARSENRLGSWATLAADANQLLNCADELEAALASPSTPKMHDELADRLLRQADNYEEPHWRGDTRVLLREAAYALRASPDALSSVSEPPPRRCRCGIYEINHRDYGCSVFVPERVAVVSEHTVSLSPERK